MSAEQKGSDFDPVATQGSYFLASQKFREAMAKKDYKGMILNQTTMRLAAGALALWAISLGLES